MRAYDECEGWSEESWGQWNISVCLLTQQSCCFMPCSVMGLVFTGSVVSSYKAHFLHLTYHKNHCLFFLARENRMLGLALNLRFSCIQTEHTHPTVVGQVCVNTWATLRLSCYNHASCSFQSSLCVSLYGYNGGKITKKENFFLKMLQLST